VKKNYKYNWFTRFMANHRLQTILFITWLFVILVLSVIPDNTPDYIKLDLYEFRIDYLKHFFVFLPLGFLMLSMRNLGFFLIVLFAIIAVSAPEIVQYFIPYRTFNPMDLAFNCIGFVFGMFVRSYFIRKFGVREA